MYMNIIKNIIFIKNKNLWIINKTKLFYSLKLS